MGGWGGAGVGGGGGEEVGGGGGPGAKVIRAHGAKIDYRRQSTSDVLCSRPVQAYFKLFTHIEW